MTHDMKNICLFLCVLINCPFILQNDKMTSCHKQLTVYFVSLVISLGLRLGLGSGFCSV